MIVNVGQENIWDLMNVRICDRIGTGRPKADPYRLRKYKSMVEEALRDPVSVGMLKIDGKKIMEVAKILDLEQRAPFIHSSGKIGSNYLCTGVMFPIAPNPNKNDSILAFDLKFDPRPYFKKTSAELKELFYTNSSKLFSIGERNIPVKAIDFGKCPALAPIDVLDKQAEERIGVNKQTIQKNLELLLSGGSSFIQNIYQAYKTEEGTFKTPTDSEFRIYDGFLNDSDRLKCQKITKLEPDQLVDKNFDFTDERLNQLLIAYKARNWPEILNEDEARYWQNYISERISYGRSGQLSQPEFSKKIKYLKTIYSKDTDKIKLLNDLESLI
jgi:exodeoxyribonuclease-1